MASDWAAVVAAGGGLVMALDVALKATGLLVVAYLVHAGLGRRRALARAWLWNAALVGLALIPVATLVSPRLSLPVLVARPAPPAEAPGPVGPAGGSPIAAPAAVSAASASPDLAESVALPAASALAPTIDPPPSRAVLATPPRRRWDWGRVALAAYLAGVGLLLGRLVAALGAVARLRRGARRLDDPAWCAALDRWRPQLGIARAVALARSDRVAVPVVVGWLRPTILVPGGLADSAPPGLVDAVLVHELAHVRRGDYGWNLLRKWVGASYWPHPLTWPLGRIVGAAREQACDDLCVRALGGAPAYRDSLLAVAATLAHARPPEVALGLAMARRSHLVRRLAWIDRTPGAPSCLPRRPARVATLLLVAALATLIGAIDLAHAQAPVSKDEPQPIATQAMPNPGPPAAIEVEVRAHDTGQPLVGAKFKFWVDQTNVDGATDAAGKIRFDLSSRRMKDELTIDVWAEGYVQQRFEYAENDGRHSRIPPQVTIKLWPGDETLGGSVVDEANRPIAGAQVRVWGYLGAMKDRHELVTWVGATTNEAGRWRCRSFRKMQFAYLYLTHPDYLSDNQFRSRPHREPTPGEQTPQGNQPMVGLRDFTDLQVMKRGAEISGRVFDGQGQAIRGAKVGWLGADVAEASDDDIATTTTDATGGFRFPHVVPGRVMIQVKAAGHAPALQAVEAKPEGEPVTITLGEPRTLAGRIVDTAGRPIGDANVKVDSWRGYRSIGFTLRTDGEGRFRWDDAPADFVLLDAWKPGYKAIMHQKASPDDGEILFTLRRSLLISGGVRDAATGRLIEQARVEVGIPNPAAGATSWGGGGGGFSVREGRMHVEFDAESAPAYRLRLTATGYQPFESRVFQADEGWLNFNVKLAKADEPPRVPVAGVVRRADGTPLVGAQVTLAYPYNGQDTLPQVQVSGGNVLPFNKLVIATTDAAGRFNLQREPEPVGKFFAVVVAHPDGYAEVLRAAFEADPTIVARPWGRVEGVARVGSQPAAGAKLHVSEDRGFDRQTPYVRWVGQASADLAGHFGFDRVAAGDVWVNRDLKSGGASYGQPAGALVAVRSGETVQIQVGGRGRPVMARIALPEGFDPAADYTTHSRFWIHGAQLEIPYPNELLTQADGAKAAWAKQWLASPTGYEQRNRQFTFLNAELKTDGTIRVEDVPPGEYQLNLTYTADPSSGPFGTYGRLAYASRQFFVPPMAGWRSDEPLDLGTLRPRPKGEWKVGDPAPGLSVAGLDRGRVRLGDYRGKFVLVSFGASWLEASVGEVAQLKAVQERFGKDEWFAMIGLSLDADREAARRLAAERGLPGRQGWLGDWSGTDLPDAYRVETIPASFLIGPDGEIRASGLRGDAILPAVERALREG